MRYLEWSIYGQKIEQRLTEVEKKGNGELVLNGCKDSVWDKEKVLEMVSMNGYITMRTYITTELDT